jgi:hypothetical protein
MEGSGSDANLEPYKYLWIRNQEAQNLTNSMDLGSGTLPETISGIFELFSIFFTWQAACRS